jgi:hypothetical protein
MLVGAPVLERKGYATSVTRVHSLLVLLLRRPITRQQGALLSSGAVRAPPAGSDTCH